jgi:hypothetical protein
MPEESSLSLVITCYIPKHFKAYELVDRKTYNKWGERSFMFFDPRLLYTLDQIREHFGKPVTVNTWKQGGKFQWRGLRNPACPEYSVYSMHTLGRAVDFTVKGISASKVRQEILKHADKFEFITRIEDGVSWVHMDLANVDGRIVLFKA